MIGPCVHQTAIPAPGDTASGPIARTLGKGLKARHVTMISIGGIIGAGLFVGSSASIAATGPAVIVSYLIAGAIILSVMRMLGEMATAVPGVSSFTEFARLGLGHWAGFVSGWLYWYFWAIVVAIEVIAGSVIIQTFIPLPAWLIGLVLLTTMTAINLMSARHYGEFEYWFASLKVAAILAFLIIAGSYAFGLTSPHGPTFDNWFMHGGFAPNGTVAVLAAVTSVIFALCGAEIATIAAAESDEPARTVARLTTSVVVRIALFYVCSMALIVAIVPWNEIRVGYSPFAAALDRIGIPFAAAILQGVVLVAVLSCLNSGLFVTSRVLFTLASHGDAPQALVALSRRQVPARAILLGSAVGYIGVLTSFASPDRVFAFLVNASGALMIIIYLIETGAQIRLRRHFEKSNPAALQVKMWLFPALSYLTGAVLIAVLAAMALTPELASQFYSGIVCLTVAGLAYRVRARSGGLCVPLDRRDERTAAELPAAPTRPSTIDAMGDCANAWHGPS
jgi:GABA permease